MRHPQLERQRYGLDICTKGEGGCHLSSLCARQACPAYCAGGEGLARPSTTVLPPTTGPASRPASHLHTMFVFVASSSLRRLWIMDCSSPCSAFFFSRYLRRVGRCGWRSCSVCCARGTPAHAPSIRTRAHAQPHSLGLGLAVVLHLHAVARPLLLALLLLLALGRGGRGGTEPTELGPLRCLLLQGFREQAVEQGRRGAAAEGGAGSAALAPAQGKGRGKGAAGVSSPRQGQATGLDAPLTHHHQHAFPHRPTYRHA